MSDFPFCCPFGRKAERFCSPADRLWQMSRSSGNEYISPLTLSPQVCMLISSPCMSYSSVLQSCTTTPLDFPCVSFQSVLAMSLFRLPIPCYETQHAQSILICAENTFKSVFTSCWSLDCYPTNSSIPFIMEAKLIPYAVCWMVHSLADLRKTKFIRTQKILFYQP